MSYTDTNISLVRSNTNSTAFDSGEITENTVNSYANLFYPYLLDNGGNNKNVSLTIDILNKEELENETKDFSNKNWVNKNRLDNNVSTSKAIWGFKEAFHGIKKSRAISNAFVFSGQQITFYIAPQGHGTGYIDNQWVYGKTTITITAIDVVNGTNVILDTFSGFEKKSDDTTRYFNWTVPSPDNNTFSSYGLFGLVVLRIDVSQSYYLDAQWTVPLEESVPYLNQSHLQLLIYSGAREIIDVTNVGDLSIVTGTISSTDTLEQIFSDTVFDNLQSLNQNPLTIANKRAIIADQIATLFISQHPVITADFYPGKIIGSGAGAAVPPRKVLEKAIIYSKRYPEIVPMVIDRLYGMIATYKAFNFCADIEKYISDYTQSTQVTKDPVRVIYMDEDGNVEIDLGIDGLIFDPYALSVLNTETILDCPDATPIDITLQEGRIDIQNIQILDALGVLPVQPHSKNVRVSFDVTFGASYISQIRYSLFSQEGLNYNTYTDTTGLSRYYVFNLDNEVIPKPAKKGDVVSCQIDIQDVDGLVTSFVYSLGLQGYVVKPTLRDLKIYQRCDGSDIVNVEFTYSGLGEINNSYVYLQFSSDNGVHWSTVKTTSAKGDVGINVQPGRRMITWKPLIDLSNYSDRIFARISLYDSENNLAEGDSLTGELVKSLNKPEIAVMRVPLS